MAPDLLRVALIWNEGLFGSKRYTTDGTNPTSTTGLRAVPLTGGLAPGTAFTTLIPASATTVKFIIVLDGKASIDIRPLSPERFGRS